MNGTDRFVALFIDADNAPASHVDVILNELASFGTVSIRRAYGNWKGDRLSSWEKLLHEYAIQPIQQFDLTKGKNATDIALVIDAMDALYSRRVDVFALVSSDSDFTPLATRLQADGKTVVGFGERKTPTPFVNACSKFLYLDMEAAPQENSSGSANTVSVRKWGVKELKSDTKLVTLLRNAVQAAEADDGWSPLGRVGSHIANQASFDSRNYGYKKLVDLFRASELFDLETREDKGVFLRDKRKAKGT
ncbi:NYN domain-containing protein [Uliginosibacterium sp. 31-16]|uniref:NYN domain-containing protein n=1 Tax=Uliginosibacterium sp. 31-16 TaxID=3068315 RepID=UPI00273E23C4|nr:NYN domain-containing protein [Uliginosibacterium sp. 31-16]MDP5238509.1 NYN domain-containing protein [Uliginosibacterium sp. 31-16]